MIEFYVMIERENYENVIGKNVNYTSTVFDFSTV